MERDYRKIAEALDRAKEASDGFYDAEIIDVIYDTLMEYTNYIQLDVDKVENPEVGMGVIEFEYTVDELYTEDGVKERPPRKFKVRLDIYIEEV